MVRIDHVDVTVGTFQLHDIVLDIADREYFVVLGPTGAGKTVLLECIAGLTPPRRGRVWLGGRDVTSLPPEQRRVGYLPQDYALFPHLTVRENLAFGLMVRGREDDIPASVERYAGLLGIGALLERLPAKLSGGEKQRVALGRALAIDPEIVLLDEPLSALDVATRERISDELRRIHDSTGMTTLHICHNFDETLRLADRVALVNQGRVVQVGTPEDLLRRPRSLFAAEFVRSENILRGHADGAAGAGRVRVGEVVLAVAQAPAGPVWVTLRPDDIEVLPPEATPAAANAFPATVEAVETRADGYALHTRGALALTAFVSRPQARDLAVEPGRRLALVLPPNCLNAFPAAD